MFVAWSFGVSLVFFVCSGISVVLFDTSGISRRRFIGLIRDLRVSSGDSLLT